ncbi:MAG: Thioredoxin [Candidatus Ordinivivax streblomastigis]|uniref:Thioredoxin n=1 Tax=Candidatus Ordinivivax streblomastigis TaxID=2540710 RepID=A0A5M8NYI8_9BACT|nr:MAG: Thioredoxin [Candidatus Ordinivivax streblomastigis]
MYLIVHLTLKTPSFMKQLKFVGAMLLLLCCSSCTRSNDKVIERPPFIWNHSCLEIDKVVLSDTVTVFYMKAFYPPHNWIKIASTSFLTDDKGERYILRSTEGITMDEEFYMPDSGEAEFQLIFPTLPASVSSVDFSEGDNIAGAFKIWGIQLKSKTLPKLKLPKETKPDINAVLPEPEFKNGTAQLKVQILGYRKGMPTELNVTVRNPIDYPPTDIVLQLNEDGTFSGDIPAYTSHVAVVQYANKGLECFLAPGETTSLAINLHEIFRIQSHLRQEEKPYGKPVYYSGYLASLSQELATVRPQFPSIEDNYCIKQLLSGINGKSEEEIKEYFITKHRERTELITGLEVSPACKQVLRCETNLLYVFLISQTPSVITQAYIANNKLQGEKAQKYYNAHANKIPDNLLDVLKDLLSLPANETTIFYCPNTSSHIYVWGALELEATLTQSLGTNQGILFDLLHTAEISRQINNFISIDSDKIAQLNSPFKEVIKAKNDELLVKIEANKKITGFTVNAIGEVSNKDLFPSILSKYKGKVILVDVWATWCGPCVMANKAIKPLKEEWAEKAGKDIVYVYIAGENSPLGTWNNMIPDLKGEHFRLTSQQWEYLCSEFKIEGVPTYFIVDRKGNIASRMTGFPGVETVKSKLTELMNK